MRFEVWPEQVSNIARDEIIFRRQKKTGISSLKVSTRSKLYHTAVFSACGHSLDLESHISIGRIVPGYSCIITQSYVWQFDDLKQCFIHVERKLEGRITSDVTSIARILIEAACTSERSRKSVCTRTRTIYDLHRMSAAAAAAKRVKVGARTLREIRARGDRSISGTGGRRAQRRRGTTRLLKQRCVWGPIGAIRIRSVVNRRRHNGANAEWRVE